MTRFGSVPPDHKSGSPKSPEGHKYMEMLDLLSKAEMAARNGQWGTCHTACKNAGDIALKWHQEWRKK